MPASAREDVLVNIEADVTVGRVLKRMAQRAGVPLLSVVRR
jgi:predicted homoserine dehydrogenase-like protein